MPPYRQGTTAMLIGAWFWTLLCSPARAAPSSEAERQYQKGLSDYAQGRRVPALAAFQEALRLDPKSPSARAAVQRITLEVSRPDVYRPTPAAQKGSALASLEEALDDFLLRQAPRYFRFERTVGDARSDQGTLAAMQGRVAQLMGERRLSLSRRSPFAKEREFRSLVRRLPQVLA